MSRAQERGPDSGLQSDTQAAKTGAQAAKTGSQAAQKLTGATGSTGTTSGAGATGATGTTGTTTTQVRERTTTTTPSASYGRSTTPATGYRTGRSAGTSTAGMAGGVLAVLTGLLTFLAGLGAVVRRGFYPLLPNYAYSLNPRNWGIILLVLGVLLFAAGAVHLLGMAWGRAAAVGLAVLTAIAGFLFLAYSPVWGVIIVLLSAATIWGLLSHGGSSADRSDSSM
jgi:hypothetical protein